MDFHHLLLLKILRKKGLREIYAMMSLRTMAMSLISIFVPIYLYTLGYGIQAIILFFIVSSGTHILMCPLSAKISSSLGFKHGMLFSFPFYFIHYVMLSLLAGNGQLIYATAVLFGVAQAMFWVPFHAFFSTLTDGKKRGEEVALLDIFPSICAIIAPLIGGVIILLFGFGTLFVAGLAFLLAAALPLFVTKDIRMPFTLSLKADGFDRRVAASLVSYNTQLDATLWPIFIFTIVGSAVIIGGLVAFSVALGFVIVWIVGRMCDRGYRRKFLRAGSIIQSGLWGMRALASSFVHVVGLESVWRINSKFVDVPYNSAYYERARRTRQKLAFSMLREMSIHASIIGVFVLIYVFYSLIPTLSVIFLIAAIGPLFGMLIEK